MGSPKWMQRLAKGRGTNPGKERGSGIIWSKPASKWRAGSQLVSVCPLLIFSLHRQDSPWIQMGTTLGLFSASSNSRLTPHLNRLKTMRRERLTYPSGKRWTHCPCSSLAMAVSRAGWKIPLPRSVEMTWPELNSREKSLCRWERMRERACAISIKRHVIQFRASSFNDSPICE